MNKGNWDHLTSRCGGILSCDHCTREWRAEQSRADYEARKARRVVAVAMVVSALSVIFGVASLILLEVAG